MSKDQLITQREITHVLNHPEHKKTGSIFKKILNEISLMLFVFVISFSIINWPAISTKLKYWWRVDYHNATYKPTKQSASQTFPNNRIIIQKIGVDAPIIWNIEASKIHSELSNGVVHYKGTAQAGETGNVFFSGHSSDFIWAKGDYKNVFEATRKKSFSRRYKALPRAAPPCGD
jgi:sortase (surface protein transpeptidase)